MSIPDATGYCPTIRRNGQVSRREPDNPRTVLQEAQQTVNGGADDPTCREGEYGHPADHFARTARLVTAYLYEKLKPGEEITAKDWGMMMNQDKVARTLGPRVKRDTYVDGPGYWAATARVVGLDP